jgi:HrpA-like RNA helicase
MLLASASAAAGPAAHRSYACAEEVLSIAAMLSTESVFFSAGGNAKAAQKEKMRFAAHEGDHVSLLNVYNSFIENKQSKTWALSRFLNFKSLKKAVEIRRQLRKALMRLKNINYRVSGIDRIRKCVASGYFQHAAALCWVDPSGRNVYRSVLARRRHKKQGAAQRVGGLSKRQRLNKPRDLGESMGHASSIAQSKGDYKDKDKDEDEDEDEGDGEEEDFFIHPTSVLTQHGPQCIVYHELVTTAKKCMMRYVCSIDPTWLAAVAPALYTTEGT